MYSDIKIKKIIYLRWSLFIMDKDFKLADLTYYCVNRNSLKSVEYFVYPSIY